MKKYVKISLGSLLTLSLFFSGCSFFSSDSRSADQVLRDMLVAFVDVQSYNFDMKNASLKAANEEGGGEFDLSVGGKMAQRGRAFDLMLDVNGKIDMDGKSGDAALGVNLINVVGTEQDQLYVKLNKLTLPADLEAEAGFFMMAVKGMMDQWYSMPPTMLPTDMSGLQGSEDQEKRNKLKELLTKYSIFNVIKDYGMESGLRHLEVEINAKEMMNYMREAAKIMNDTLDMPETDEMSDAEIKEMMNGLTHSFSFWINPSDNLLYKSVISAKGDKDGSSFSFEAEANLDNFNKSPDIKAPENSKSIMEMMQNMPLPEMPTDGNMEIMDEVQ